MEPGGSFGLRRGRQKYEIRSFPPRGGRIEGSRGGAVAGDTARQKKEAYPALFPACVAGGKYGGGKMRGGGFRGGLINFSSYGGGEIWGGKMRGGGFLINRSNGTHFNGGWSLALPSNRALFFARGV